MNFSSKNYRWQTPTWNTSFKPRTILLGGVAAFLSIVFTASLIHTPTPLKDAISRFRTPSGSKYAELSEHALNSTLGFQDVFHISLPHRTDRQDAMSLLSDFTGFRSKLIDGVVGDDVQDNARIIGSKLKPAQFGCWRSHANAWRRIVSEDIQTALILEDDADWDINIKDQLYRISQGILNGPNLVADDPWADWKRESPYGTEWDLFFVGYCSYNSKNEKKRSEFVAFPDPSVPELDKIKAPYRTALSRFNITEPQTRAVVRLEDMICTTGYGVTKRGAWRLLYQFGYKDFGSPVDNLMSWAVQDGRLRGIAPLPPLVQQFKIGGGVDSNINKRPDGKKGQTVETEKGHTPSIKDSARKAMKELSQWNSQPWK